MKAALYFKTIDCEGKRYILLPDVITNLIKVRKDYEKDFNTRGTIALQTLIDAFTEMMSKEIEKE